MHKLRDAPGDAEADLKAQIEKIAGKGKVLVLGLGNIDRGDDGAGVLVAEELKRLFPSYSYSEHDGVEGTVLDISERDEELTVFFVDASDMKMNPGSIAIVTKDEIKDTEITTHRVAIVLMASILERAGKKSAVICIQPKAIEFREPVSNPVKSSVDRLVRVLAKVVDSRD